MYRMNDQKKVLYPHFEDNLGKSSGKLITLSMGGPTISSMLIANDLFLFGEATETRKGNGGYFEKVLWCVWPKGEYG